MSHKIMSEVFKLRDSPRDQIHSFYNGTESASYLGQRFWSKYLKTRNLSKRLKEKSKNGKPLNVHVEFVGHVYLT